MQRTTWSVEVVNVMLSDCNDTVVSSSEVRDVHVLAPPTNSATSSSTVELHAVNLYTTNPSEQTHTTMATICHRCALRLRHAARAAPARSFSSTAATQKGGMPAFNESPNPELNEVLSTIRNKIFMPNYLEKGERKLLFKAKYRQQLIDNPQNVTIGDEEIPLEPMDLLKDLPKRSTTVKEALDIIMSEGSKDWHQLPKLLQGLKEGVKRPLRKEAYARVVRCAMNADKIGVVLQCLETPDRTGMTLRHEEVRKILLDGLHHMAQDHEWSEAATGRALRDANVVSRLLENEEHGGGRRLQENDPRQHPETVGLFLELASVYVYLHADANDTEGLVKAYAGRLMSCLEKGHVEVSEPSCIGLVIY